MVNWIRGLQGKYHIWLVPGIEYRSGNLYDSIGNFVEKTSKAIVLHNQVENVLLHAPVSEAKKKSFEYQSFQILFNLNKALWKQARSWNLYLAINHDTPQSKQSKMELESMMSKLNREIERSLDVLTTVSVSLLNVELAHGDAELDRLLNELDESNRRLRELSDAYKDSKNII